MSLKDRWAKIKSWRAMLTRTVRLKAASWLLSPIGCVSVGGDVLLMSVQKLAELDSYIEKSGDVRTNTHAYEKLTSRVRQISQLIEIATRAGDPGTNAKQLIDVYGRARWMSMSKNQRAKYQQMQAAQAMTNLPQQRKGWRKPIAPPKATVAAPKEQPVAAAAAA